MALRIHLSWLHFIFISLCALLVLGVGSISAVTPHWSRVHIPDDLPTPLTTATGGYDLTGSYYAGLFQFCLENPTEGTEFGTCYGITMPMDFTCHGPSGESVRTGSQLYVRIVSVRICMLLGILFSLSVAIVTCIGSFKRRKAIYNWCAFALAALQSVAFTGACALYGHTESYWYKCGHNQCAGIDRCLFSFGHSYALAIGCMFLSFFILGYLWSLRKAFPVAVRGKSVGLDSVTSGVQGAGPNEAEGPKGAFPWSQPVGSTVKPARESNVLPRGKPVPATRTTQPPLPTAAVEPQGDDESQSSDESS